MIKRIGALVIAVSVILGSLMINAPVQPVFATSGGVGG
jgi:hypothetical protein